MKELFDMLNALTPAGFAALLAFIIYQLVMQKKADKVVAEDLKSVKDNHLSGLPEIEGDVKRIVYLLEAQGPLLQSMNNSIILLLERSKHARSTDQSN